MIRKKNCTVGSICCMFWNVPGFPGFPRFPGGPATPGGPSINELTRNIDNGNAVSDIFLHENIVRQTNELTFGHGCSFVAMIVCFTTKFVYFIQLKQNILYQ